MNIEYFIGFVRKSSLCNYHVLSENDVTRDVYKSQILKILKETTKQSFAGNQFLDVIYS